MGGHGESTNSLVLKALTESMDVICPLCLCSIQAASSCQAIWMDGGGGGGGGGLEFQNLQAMVLPCDVE